VTLLLPLLAFLFATLIVGAGAMLYFSRSSVIEQRLGEIAGPGFVGPAADPAYQKVVVDTLKRLGNMAPKSPSDMSKMQLRLVAAGFRRSEALIIFSGIRVGVALTAFALLSTPLLVRPSLSTALVGAILGYMLPSIVLAKLAARRQHKIQMGLPDALDLLVVSVEAGLGLDQAIQRVGQELAFAHPDLCEEMRLVNLELRAGKPRSEALSNLGARTGVEDVISLVAMLVQTDKFGTSVAQSLRVHSDTLRTKRRQRAEEKAAKLGAKMVFPLVTCIFPAIWVVTIGPAAIKFMEVFAPMAAQGVPR
jgi:tight adherence protein C